MNILYTNFHRSDGGGHTTYVMNLIRVLHKQHRITIAAPASSRLFQEAQSIAGIHAVALDFSNRLPILIQSTLAIRRLIKSQNIDIVHVNGSADHRAVMLATAGMQRKRPRIVLTKHNDLPAKGMATWLKARFATDSVICVCDYTRRMLMKTSYGRGRLDVVYNGVDLTHYTKPDAATIEAARLQWLPAGKQQMLVLGSNAGTSDQKGWLDLVEAVASMPEQIRSQIHILLAGELPSVMQQEKVAALGMMAQVTFTGILKDVRQFVAAIDVGFVLSHQETISFACREMMAMGKPVLISRVGGLPENVTPEIHGWIVPAQDPAAIACMLKNIFEHRYCLDTMGAEAHAKAGRDFSLEKFVGGTEGVYAEILERRQMAA